MAQRPSYASISHRESFSHERLKLAENSIRLFQVQAGNKTDPISLRITQYASHRRPAYKAISYTWGSAADLRQILVNGRGFMIHYNLWSLLFQLRQRKETTFLWADALCIDQANLKERNFHVQLMGKIYDQAENVTVWLGLPSPDRTEIRALEFVKELNVFRKTKGDMLVASTYLQPGIQHRWDTLLRMCRHRYWTRTWIVQEFLRAAKVEVMCGAAVIDWIEFEHLLPMFQTHHFNQHGTIHQLLQSRPARLTLRRQTGVVATLHELLKEYHDSMCTEKRDKVYGILGLASDCGEDQQTGEPLGVLPDYTKHIVEVYIDAVSCIEKSLVSRTLVPSIANLVQRSLLINSDEISEYIRSSQAGSREQATLKIAPAYVGIVDQILPSWTSMRDLTSQLNSIDWGQYVGYEMRQTRVGGGRRSSTRAIHSAIPDDMLQNVLHAAESEPAIAHLHNYPPNPCLTIPADHVALHTEDKRLYDNTNMQKPRLIIDRNETVGPLQLGLACTNARRGDLIIQFRGLNMAIICRQIGHEVILIGKAVMFKHSQLQQAFGLDSVCIDSPWISPCHCEHNPEGLEFQTDVFTLLELLQQG